MKAQTVVPIHSAKTQTAAPLHSARVLPEPTSSAPEHLVTLAEVGRELTAGIAIGDGIMGALRVLDKRLGARRSVVYTADSEQRTLEIAAIHGMAGGQVRPRYGFGVAGRVAESGRPIVVPTVHREPMALAEFADAALWTDTHWNLLAVPVYMAGQRVGALVAYFNEPYGEHCAGRLGVLKVVASLLSQALRTAHLEQEEHRADVDTRHRSERTAFEYANMIGASAAMRQIYEQIGQVARTNATALIRGESGTGKELVAHAIHVNSERAREPFVKINCAALPETLFESELFGHERGAFTGAVSRKKGRFELAHGGTLFLDEVGELSPMTQAKLLRVLQFREFERLGGTQTLKADVRIIVATNKDMERAVANGSFREDLYYRINVFSLTLPALRERRADIPALAEYFLARFAAEHRRRIARISSAALDALHAYTFPGNVRELENIIERAVVVCDGFVIQEHHLPENIRAAVRDNSGQPATLAEAVARVEREMIEAALRNARGNAARAARVLGTTERIVRYKASKYAIDYMRFRG